MQSLRLGAALLVLVLMASACGDDEEPGDEPTPSSTTTTESAPSTTEPTITPPTTSAVVDDILDPPTIDDETPIPTTTVAETVVAVGAPPPPVNVECLAGSGEGRLLLEWDAPASDADVAKIRVYVSEDGGPFITNGEFAVDDIDTARDGGTRWAAPARSVPANVPLRLAVTSFNQLGQESGWWPVAGSYTGAGQPCSAAEPTATTLPPTTCTAGCDEGEGEPAP